MNTERRLLIQCKYFSYGHGGTPEAVLLLARSLERTGIRVDVQAHDRFVADAGRLGDLPPFDPPAGKRPTLQIAQYSSLIVAGAWIFEAVPAALAARRAGVPIIYQPKGQLCRIEFSRTRDIRKLIYLLFVETWIALLASHIQFTSRLEQEASLLPRWLKRQKGFVLPEPLDGDRLGRVERTHYDANAPLRLGFIAQISPRKGLREFVEGLLAWSEAHPRHYVDFAIAGTSVGASEAYLAGIRALVAARPCDARISFIGQISGAERAQFYARTDVIVVPSHFESFCLAVPEALWYGCSVLASPNLGVLEFLADRQEIFRLPPTGPGAVSQAIDIFVRSVEEIRRTAVPNRTIPCFEPPEIARGIIAHLGVAGQL